MSGDRYFIKDQNAIYFLTFTVVDWLDIFSRKEYKIIATNALNYCINNKGLIVYSWCIMTNHIHLIARAKEGYKLSEIIRDYKKYVAKACLKEIEEINESRKIWLLNRMKFRGSQVKRVKNYKFWEDDNHAIVLESNSFKDKYINYIHQNPTAAMIVDQPEHYIFSSAKDYSCDTGLVNVELLL